MRVSQLLARLFIVLFLMVASTLSAQSVHASFDSTSKVFRLDGAGWSLAGTWRDRAIVRAQPFEAIELELGALWTR